MIKYIQLFYTSILTINLFYTSNCKWVLNWQDDFNNGSLNLTNWEYSDLCEGRTPYQPWGNQELQCYSNSTGNVRIENGSLILTAIPLNSPINGHNFTSGKLIGRLGFTFGKFEARLRVPEGKHLWPAFWMLPLNYLYGHTFAASGEIDIMELRGQSPNQIESTIHYGGVKPNFISEGGFVGDFYRSYSDDFHTSGCIWDEKSIKFYVDDLIFHEEHINRSLWSGKGTNPYTKSGQPFDQPFQINLNLAVGGLFFDPSDHLSLEEARKWKKPYYEIDYVKVYKWV